MVKESDRGYMYVHMQLEHKMIRGKRDKAEWLIEFLTAIDGRKQRS